MNVGDWVEIDTGFWKGTPARIYDIRDGFISVSHCGSGIWQCVSFLGEGCFKQKPTTPNKEYEDLFL